jgi:hypothetical protein
MKLSRRLRLPVALAALSIAASFAAAADEPCRLAVRNELDAARSGETVELSAAALAPCFKAADLAKVHVFEEPGARELLVQAVDSDGNWDPDQLVFQADFAARQRREFRLATGEVRKPGRDEYRVYGRFVRERFDDFAWENDKVAFRMYGTALETWEREALTSSAVDAWEKKTRRLVQSDWYMVDDYHKDHGEGGDFYPAGKSRGCGGSGVWSAGRLFVSKNFRDSRVLANGPIRLIFELSYPLWDTAGIKASERKRVTLDAGSNLVRFESAYTVEAPPGWSWASGIRKAGDAQVRVARELGIVRTWEALKNYGDNGQLGCGIVVDPARVADVVEADGNVLVVGKPATPGTYYAGSGWNRSGDFADVAAWDRYLEDFARRVASPLKIEIAAR